VAAVADNLEAVAAEYAGRGYAPVLVEAIRVQVSRLRASLVSPPKAGSGEPVAWRWKAHGHEDEPWIVVHDEGTAKAAMSLFASKGTPQAVQPLYANHEARGDGVRVKPLSLENFAADFNAAMERTGATVRGLAEKIGVDKSAISRARRGKQVSQENFIALLNWLEAPLQPRRY